MKLIIRSWLPAADGQSNKRQEHMNCNKQCREARHLTNQVIPTDWSTDSRLFDQSKLANIPWSQQHPCVCGSLLFLLHHRVRAQVCPSVETGTLCPVPLFWALPISFSFPILSKVGLLELRFWLFSYHIVFDQYLIVLDWSTEKVFLTTQIPNLNVKYYIKTYFILILLKLPPFLTLLDCLHSFLKKKSSAILYELDT